MPAVWWCAALQEVNEAFDELEEGNEDALKGEYERQVNRKELPPPRQS